MERCKFFHITHREHVVCNPMNIEKLEEMISLLRLKPKDRALEIAQRIASQAPLAVQATKASARRYVNEGVQACIAALNPVQAELIATEDAQEGVNSFIERRDAVFTGK